MELAAQVIGILAMTVNILVVQFKKPQHIFLCRAASSFLWALNMLLLGSPTGAVLNVINIVRSLFLLGKKTSEKPFLYITMGLYALSGLLTMEYSLSIMALLSVLIILSQCIDTVAMWSKNPTYIRYSQLFAISPVWLVHNIYVFSIGGILAESFAIVSAIIALIRFRGQKPA